MSSKRRRRTLKPTFNMLARRWWPVVVWLIILRLESTDFASSANTISVLQNLVDAVFGSVSPALIDAANSIARKSGHFVGYAILSLFVFRALKYTQYDRLRLLLHRRWGIFFRDLWRKDWALIAILFTVVAAMFDELHQAIIPSRTGRWQDVALDTAGAIAMQLLLYARASHAISLQRKYASKG